MNRKFISFLIISILLFSSCNLSAFTKRSSDHSIGNKEGIENRNLFDEKTAVQQVKAYMGLDTDKIRISWNEKDGANRYIIERAMYDSLSLPDTSDDEKKDAFVESLNFERLENSVNTKYYEDYSSGSRRKDVYYVYRVYAQSLDNRESLASDIAIGAFLNVPLNLSASKGKSEDAITIEFTQTPGSSKYQLFKNTTNSFSNNLEAIQTKANVSDLEGGKNSFVYNVTNDEKGKELYFSIKSVSSDKNIVTDFSTSSKGYTRVQGAPVEPKVTTSKGTSRDSIRVTFSIDGDDGNYIFQIMKSKNGGGEALIVDTADDPTALEKNGNEYIYEDTNVQANTKYSYSVSAKNASGIGPAGKDENGDAYILSPPQAISANPINTNEKCGYELSLTSPIGYNDNKNLVYIVKTTTKVGTVNEQIYEHNFTSPFYEVNKNKETDDEIRVIEVQTKNTSTNEISDSVRTVITGIPEKVTSFTGTENVYDDSIGAQNGIYPVILEWTSSSAYKYYIERYDVGTTNNLETFETTDTRYNDKKIEVGKKYDYRLYAEDALGRTKGYMEVKGKYGAITASQFAAEFERNCAKPWEFQELHPEYAHTSSKGAIWGLIRNEGTGSLGSASATDDYLHGTVTYSASVKGFGGQLKFTYTPGFGEAEYIHFLTEDESKEAGITIPQGYDSYVGMSGDGDYTPWNGQKFYLSGWYGKNIIDATSISTKSKKLSGLYKVIMTYNTKDGKTIQKEGVATPLLRGKVS